MITIRKPAVLILLVLLSLWGCSKAPDDAAIADSLKARFFSDPQLKTEPIGIDVSNGEVTLTGAVSTEAMREQARNLARGAPGVKNVNDFVQVRPAMTAEVQPPPAPVVEPKTPRPQPKQPLAAAPAQPPTVAEPPVPAAPAPPQPKIVTIPEGTEVRIQMIDSVSSDKNKIGSTFLASLQAPLVVENEVVVPKGVDVHVKLLDAKSAGKFKGSSELHLALDSLEFQGIRYPLTSSTYDQVGDSRGKQTAKRVGIGAAVGTAIGAIAGGGKGAAIGAGVGAGAGTAAQVFTKGKQVQVPSETKLDFRLEEPVQITIMPKQK